jgi:hypothetical protein
MPNPKKTRRLCKVCGKEVGLYVAVYCSNRCQAEHKYRTYINKWKSGEVSGGKAGHIVSGYVRKYLIERDGEKCSRCGWAEKNPVTNKVPLEVHHVNGNHTDHSENNVKLLCPNCHSLTPTYRNLNKGNGRKYRKIMPA